MSAVVSLRDDDRLADVVALEHGVGAYAENERVEARRRARQRATGERDDRVDARRDVSYAAADNDDVRSSAVAASRVDARSTDAVSRSARTTERDEAAVDEDTVTVTRTQTRCRSTLERAMLSSDYTRARERDAMRFQDLRSRLFGLARTFDPDNRRTVCELVRSLTIDYFASLYEMSYRAYRFFDAGAREASALLPVTLAVSAAVYADRASGGRADHATTEWLMRRTVEDFCRVHFYRIYEYLRCYEIQRIVALETFDRDDYAEYVIALFLAENETLARQRDETAARWRRASVVAADDDEARRCCGDISDAIFTAAKTIRCVRAMQLTAMEFDERQRRSPSPPCDSRSAQRIPPTWTSMDLALAASTQRSLRARDAWGRRRRQSSSRRIAAIAFDGSDLAAWPYWNLPLSTYVASLARARAVGSVDERFDVTAPSGDDSDAWTRLTAESYDYMSMYRRNANYDRLDIRGDDTFYTDVFATLFRVVMAHNDSEK